VHDGFEDVARLEIIVRAREVNEAACAELSFFVEHEANAPGAARNRLAAVSTRCLALRSFRSIDARKAMVCQARSCGALQRVAIVDAAGPVRQCLEQRFGTLVRRAKRMEPQCRLAGTERVRHPLAEAQLAALQRAAAASALGAPACRRLEDVGHAATVCVA